MTKYEHQAAILSVLSAGVSLGLSIYMREGHWFARSGAVITLVAIWFASLELRERLAKSSLFVDEQLKILRPESLSKAKSAGVNAEQAEARLQEIEKEIRDDVSAEAKKASRRLLRMELLLFVIGTVIWGFGDLPLDSLFRWLVEDACLDSGGRWNAVAHVCER